MRKSTFLLLLTLPVTIALHAQTEGPLKSVQAQVLASSNSIVIDGIAVNQRTGVATSNAKSLSIFAIEVPCLCFQESCDEACKGRMPIIIYLPKGDLLGSSKSSKKSHDGRPLTAFTVKRIQNFRSRPYYP